MEGKQGQSKEAATSLESRLKNIKELLEETTTELKVLKSMRKRHNADKIVYDQRKFDAEQLLNHKRTQFNIYKKEGMSEEEANERSNKIFEKLQDELIAEQREREEHIQNLENMIEEKLALGNINARRED